MTKKTNQKNSKQRGSDKRVWLRLIPWAIVVFICIGLVILFFLRFQVQGVVGDLKHVIEHERKYTYHHVMVIFKDGRTETFYAWNEDLVIGRKNIITYGIDRIIRSVKVDTDPGVYPLTKHTYAKKSGVSLIEGVVKDVELVDPHTRLSWHWEPNPINVTAKELWDSTPKKDIGLDHRIFSSYGYTVVKFDDGTIKIFKGWIAKFVIGKKNTIGYKGRKLISVDVE